MRESCPSAINCEQFEAILPILGSSGKHICPRKNDLYDLFCSVLYILKLEIQWRMFGKNYLQVCYYYFVYRVRKK